MRALKDGLGCHDIEKATREKPFQNSTVSQISWTFHSDSGFGTPGDATEAHHSAWWGFSRQVASVGAKCSGSKHVRHWWSMWMRKQENTIYIIQIMYIYLYVCRIVYTEVYNFPLDSKLVQWSPPLRFPCRIHQSTETILSNRPTFSERVILFPSSRTRPGRKV